MKEKMYTYELAGLGERFVAILIDGLIQGMIIALLFGAARGAGGAVGFIIGLAYNWYFWTRRNGQTPGKQLMHIRVVKADGTPITDADAVIRHIGYVINSVIFMLGWLWAFVDSNRQGLHDKLVNTYVVKE